MFNAFGIAIFDVGSFDCVFGWSYFEKLVVVTLAPTALTALAAGVFLWSHQSAKRSATLTDSIQESQRMKDGFRSSRFIYGLSLFVYVVLPSISRKVITFFGCARFTDYGNRRGLRVITVALHIKCETKRYRRWRAYIMLIITIWPIGVPFGLGLLLFRYRKELSPPLTTNEELQRLLNEGGDRMAGRIVKEIAQATAVVAKQRKNEGKDGQNLPDVESRTVMRLRAELKALVEAIDLLKSGDAETRRRAATIAAWKDFTTTHPDLSLPARVA